MLVTSPGSRATLSEVLLHPWIVKGFDGPPSDHLPPRVPLTKEELDPEIIKGMLGFEFGTEGEIREQLEDVLDSDLYRAAIIGWEAKSARNGVTSGSGEDNSIDRPSTRVDGKDVKGNTSRTPNKRFSVLGSYGKKLAGGLNAAFAASKSEEAEVNGGTSTAGLGLPIECPDPTRGFHPLISIYYLVREKAEREKIFGAGVFASSTLSLNGLPPPPTPVSAYQSGSGIATPIPIGLSSPIATSLPPAPTSPLTPQPRQRSTGEEYPSHPATAPPSTREGEYRQQQTTFQSLPPPASPTGPSNYRSSMYVTSPASPTRQSTQQQATASSEDSPDLDEVPLATTGSGSFARRFSSLIGRSGTPGVVGEQKRHRQRASIAGLSHKAGNKVQLSSLPQVEEAQLATASPSTISPSTRVDESALEVLAPEDVTSTQGNGVRRASTIKDGNRHIRGASLGAHSTLAGTSASRPLTMYNAPSNRLTGEGEVEDQGIGFLNRNDSTFKEAKPVRYRSLPHCRTTMLIQNATLWQVYLKGLFSVATTSTKPTATIRADLIRVLDRIGVHHRDVKSGFECFHAPSIDLSSVTFPRSPPPSNPPTIKRKSSKLSTVTPNKDIPVAPDGSQLSLSVLVPDSPALRNEHDTSSSSFTILAAPHEGHPPPTSIQHQRSSALSSSSTAAEGAVANDLIVRFEISIVKMPLLPGIHGLQFRRISGNAWQYQMLAKRVLQEFGLK